MKNDLFTIGSITIHGYGLMIGIGIIAAYYLAEYRANPSLISSNFFGFARISSKIVT